MDKHSQSNIQWYKLGIDYLVKIYDSKYMIDSSTIALTRIANLLCYFGLQSTVTLD
jgi:hypothetical protein